MSALDRLPTNQFDGASCAAAGGIVAPTLNLAKQMAKTAAVPDHADLVAMAVQHGNVELLREAAAFAKDMHAIAARKAFDNAIADAKAEIPVIKKNRHVGFESKRAGAAATDYWHEDMGEIARTIDSILGKHGLSYRFRIRNKPNEPITVTCVLSHREGHFEEVEMSGPPDDTGNKNSHQKSGSAVTYLQRYTLKASLGLAAARDDDAQAAGGDDPRVISAAQIAQLKALANERDVDVERFCKLAMQVESLDKIAATDFEHAVATMKRKPVKASN